MYARSDLGRFPASVDIELEQVTLPPASGQVHDYGHRRIDSGHREPRVGSRVPEPRCIRVDGLLDRMLERREVDGLTSFDICDPRVPPIVMFDEAVERP